MKLKSRPFVHYAPVPGGVYLSGPGAQFAITGPEALFQVVDRCVPMLEVGTTEDDIVRELGTERIRPAVRMVTEALFKHGLLLNVDKLTVPEPDVHTREQFPESLAHFEAHSDDPYAAFERLRGATVLVAGPPQVVLPAARGLGRAGVSNLVIASDNVRDVSATGARLSADVVPLGFVGSTEPFQTDVAIIVLGPGDGAVELESWRGRVVATAHLVPVWLNPHAVVVGPVLGGAGEGAVVPDESWQRATALRDRVLAWARLSQMNDFVLPHGESLAGALAGQLAFETLGLLDGSHIHVVHGADADAERVNIQPDKWTGNPTASSLTAVSSLADATAQDIPDDPASLDALLGLSQRWTGSVALTSDDALPQIPFALREVTRVSDGAKVVARGVDQHQAAIAGILAAHRLPTRYGIAASDGTMTAPRTTGVNAAGLTQEHWLLDGALQLLAERAEPASPLPLDVLTPSARLYWAQLTERTDVALRVRTRTVPGLSWAFVDVADPKTGLVIASSWGPDQSVAAEHALSDALASTMCRETDGADLTCHGPSTLALLTAAGADIRRLRDDLRVLQEVEGVTFSGGPEGDDPVIGPVRLHHGRVTIEPSQEG